eukprot:gene9003-10560_t
MSMIGRPPPVALHVGGILGVCAWEVALFACCQGARTLVGRVEENLLRANHEHWQLDLSQHQITVESLQELMRERKSLEDELEKHMQYLTHGAGSVFGLRGSFVDKDGFPVFTPGSPADRAGLAKNDQIHAFGSVGPFTEPQEKAVQHLQTISVLVRNSENKSILIKYTRDNKHLSTMLTPRKWDGQGLLG